MGTLVKATDRDNTKPNYALTSPAAAAVAVADGELALFIGSSIPAQVSGWAGLTRCIQALREQQWSDPSTGQLAYAQFNVADGLLTVVADGASPSLGEGQVAILQGFGFSAAGVSNSAHCKRMFEKALEEALKVA